MLSVRPALVLPAVVLSVALPAGPSAGPLADEPRPAEEDSRAASSGSPESSRKELERQLHRYQVDLAHHAWEAGDVTRARQLLERTAPNRRGWEYSFLKRRFQPELRSLVAVGPIWPRAVRYVHFSPDSKRLASCGDDLRVKVWEVATGKNLLDIRDETRTVEFSPDGRRLVSGLSATVHLRDAASGELVRSWSGNTAIAGIPLRVQFSRDGKRVAAMDSDRGVRIWSADSQGPPLHIAQHTRRDPFAITPDGRHLAVVEGRFVSHDNRPEIQVTFYDAENGELDEARTVRVERLDWVRDLAFNADGSRMAVSGSQVGSRRGETIVYDVANRSWLHVLRGHDRAVTSVRFSPDSERIATASDDQTVKLWDAMTGDLLYTLRGHTDAVQTVAFSPDGMLLATGGRDGQIKVWDLTAPPSGFPFSSLPSPGLGAGGVLCGDGTRWLSLGISQGLESECPVGHARVRETSTARVLARVKLDASETFAGAALSFDGRQLAAVTAYHDAQSRTPQLSHLNVWDVEAGRRRWRVEVPNAREHRLAWTRDAGRLVMLSPQQAPGIATPLFHLQLWDASDGGRLTETRTRLGGTTGLTSLAFDPAGKRIAVGLTRQFVVNRWEGGVALFDGASGELQTTLEEPRGTVQAIAFSADGKRLATAVNRAYSEPVRGAVAVWDLDSRRQLWFREAHVSETTDVAYSPDGSLVGVAGGKENRPGDVRFLDAASGERVMSWAGVSGRPHQLAIGRDGGPLVTFDRDGVVRVFDLVAPSAELRAQRRAAVLVQELVARPYPRRPLLRSEIEAEIQQTALSETVRRLAQEGLAGHDDDPQQLARWSWWMCLNTDAAPDRYQQARRLAEAAHRLQPQEPRYLVVLAAALYRLAKYDEAARTLLEADGLTASGRANPSLQVMIDVRLGDLAAAGETMATLQELTEARQPLDPMTRRLFREAQRVLREPPP